MAEGPSIFLDAVVLLGGATIAAPLFKKIGLGTVLGYLGLGLLLGPIFNYIHDGESVLHVAELGIVMLLFLVGLELNPSRLWDMRREIFGLGALQVFISMAVIALIAWALYFEWQAAVIVGAGLALSSTAFALQLLEDSGDDRLPYGKRAFSILLFQDLAIAPLLVLVPLLAAGTMEFSAAGMMQIGIAVASVVALVLAGRYLLNPLFHIIADTGAKEVMIAAALFVVVGSAVLMQVAGLSMAMGAFIAGVMLAESSYRHELEADIEPFRGILLGLFFIAVGLAVDLRIVWDNILLVLAIVPAALALKAAIIYGLCRAFGSDHNEAVRVAFLLPQHGEFGFVLFSAAMGVSLITDQESSFLIACVTLSMALTPLSQRLGERLVRGDEKEHMEEDFDGAGSNILMIGFSRMGQITAQTLLAGGCHVTVIDNSAERIRQAERFGFRIYFGDGTRRDVLRSAGISKAKLVAVCTAKQDVTDSIVELITHEFPDKRLYVRSYDRGHAIRLLQHEGMWQIRETFESALVMGAALLTGSGHSHEDAELIIKDVRERDRARLTEQMEDGLTAGRQHLHSKPVPEPLTEPRKRYGQTSSMEETDQEPRVSRQDVQEAADPSPEKA
ncbi:MAG: monovalent cation:proton antiporter-2 (CPA2) family protein [Pseudomonadota bacterium]